jgi:hypothetical protein
MKKRYVTFYSPGTMVAEQTTKLIASWDVKKALKMLPEIEERYGAKPYGFRFTTKKRGIRDMEPHVIDTSVMYYVNCVVQTLEDVETEHGKNAILAQNMRTNGWDRIVTTEKGWAWSQPLDEHDVVL